MNQENFTYERISNEEYEAMKEKIMNSEEHVIYGTQPYGGRESVPELVISHCLIDAEMSFPDEEVIQIWYSEAGTIFKTRKKEGV